MPGMNGVEVLKRLKEIVPGMEVIMATGYATLETAILVSETGMDSETAGKLVKIGIAARNLKGHGLDEGISTRLLVYAATLIRGGVTPREACRMAMVRPITDDMDIRATLDHAVDAIFD